MICKPDHVFQISQKKKKRYWKIKQNYTNIAGSEIYEKKLIPKLDNDHFSSEKRNFK